MADIRAQIDRARDTASELAEAATTHIKDGTAKGGELVNKGREKFDDARNKTQDVAARANQIIQEHPITAVAGAVAAGAVIAWIFPKGRRAIRAIPAIATNAGARIAEAAAAASAAAAEGAESAGEAASRVYHSTRDAAAEGAETARAAASRAYRSARGYAADGAESAKNVTNRAYRSTRKGAGEAADVVGSGTSDLADRAARLADDLVSLASAKAEALGEAVKARLPKG